MTTTKPETLTAIFLEESHRWEKVAILRCEVRAEKKEPHRDLMVTGAVSREELSRAMVGDFADDGFLDTDDEIVTVKAYDCEEGEFESGMPFTFYGKWEEYTRKANKWHPKPKTDLQFHARKWRKVKPYDKMGVIKWLKQCPGIKEGIARRLWDAYGADAIARLKDAPEEVATEIGGGFTVERAKMASAHLQQNDAMEAAFVDLASLLDGRGFPHNLPRKLVRDYGADAAQVVKKNPWLLLRYKSTGVARVDKLYLDLGGNPAAIKRQAIILWYCILNANNGSTWITEAAANEMLKGRIAGCELKFQRAIELGIRGKLIAARWGDDLSRWLAEGKRARHEAYIAERVAEMMKSPIPLQWPEAAMLDCSEHQRERLAVALKASWSILGGSPGAGKTFCAARVIKAVAQSIGIQNIAACCPTGKAAVRLTEVMQGYGLDLKARTIHSTLGVATSTEKDGWSFKHDENDTLPYRLIVLDESSMIDTDLFTAFLKAVDKTTMLLIIGDCCQLPPVGHGRPLYDMIRAGVPCGELKEIRRNAGSIVRACAAIRDGQRFTTDVRIEFEKNPDDPDSPHNLKLLPTRNNAESVEKIVETLAKLKAKGYCPVWDVQVLVATNGVSRGKSELSRLELNKRLQRELNPTGNQTAGSIFRLHDKVVNLKNSLAIAVEDGEPFWAPGCNEEVDNDGKVYVANGELGKVIAQEEKIMTVRLDSPLRIIKVPKGKSSEGDGDNGGGGNGDDAGPKTGCSFDLAYALSTHKSQGSEFKIVVVGLDDGPAARMVCSRNWLYTAISRAKVLCLMVGKRAVADGYCRVEAVKPRVTFLAESITEEIEGLEREWK